MSDLDPDRRAAQYRAARDEAAEGAPSAYDPDDPERQIADQERREHEAARSERLRRTREQTRHLWVERQLQEAFERGDFDDLPLAGKPIPGLGSKDPDWWLKNLVEREQMTGVAPEAIQLRKDDAVLDDRLDELVTAADVRAAVEEFDARILAARRQLLGGPPVVTRPRDVEHEVARWRERRRERDAERARRAAETDAQDAAARGARRRWWSRGRSARDD